MRFLYNLSSIVAMATDYGLAPYTITDTHCLANKL